MPPVTNPPHQHAFILTGNEVLFGTRMTQYHCEIHKYQMVLRLGLPPAATATLRDFRRRKLVATFVLCNAPADPDRGIALLSVPEIASGRRPTFTGNIFFGYRPSPVPEPPEWFPWDLSWTIPMIPDVEVTVERVILFRPFAHHERPPSHPSYLLFGYGNEAHMTNLQTAGLLTGAFDAPRFGVDYDHVMSLAEAPHWLEPAMLEAGIVVSLPAIPRLGSGGHPVILPAPPRCRLCLVPFAGIGGWLMRRRGKAPSSRNPHCCNACDRFLDAFPGRHRGDDACAVRRCPAVDRLGGEPYPCRGLSPHQRVSGPCDARDHGA